MKIFYWLFLNLGLSTVHIIFWRYLCKIFYWLFLNLGLSTVHIIFWIYLCKTRLVVSVVASSGFGERRAWSNVMSEKER